MRWWHYHGGRWLASCPCPHGTIAAITIVVMEADGLLWCGCHYPRICHHDHHCCRSGQLASPSPLPPWLHCLCDWGHMLTVMECTGSGIIMGVMGGVTCHEVTT